MEETEEENKLTSQDVISPIEIPLENRVEDLGIVGREDLMNLAREREDIVENPENDNPNPPKGIEVSIPKPTINIKKYEDLMDWDLQLSKLVVHFINYIKVAITNQKPLSKILKSALKSLEVLE